MSALPEEVATAATEVERPGPDEQWPRAWEAVLPDDEPRAVVDDKIDRLIRPGDEVLDRLYGSQMVRHFYSDEEIAGFRARWSTPGP